MPTHSEEHFKNTRPPRCINPSYYQGGLDHEGDFKAEAPVAIDGNGVELRMQKLGGGMTTAFVTVNAAGGATVKTIALLTPEQVDEAANRSVDYRPPGS